MPLFTKLKCNLNKKTLEPQLLYALNMNYDETIEYLFNAAPLFQNVGGAAYKEGLSNTHLLDKYFNHPHTQFKTIHIAGTNGKGSCAHTIAAILQHKGLRVGLYTSPHLVDFRERIKVNGEMMPKEYVVNFVAEHRHFFEPLHPSFFELTTALAFKYFAEAQVDVAVIEVGLGGRLDCTNIINPVLSVITNISFDHTQFLGNTLALIASEKAGIIKKGVPVVIGEANDETRPVFEAQAQTVSAPITFAEDAKEVVESCVNSNDTRHYNTLHYGAFDGELMGECQVKNTNTILCACNILKNTFDITNEDIIYGFTHVGESTGLRGRWQILQHNPTVVCDTGHNTGGWLYLGRQLKEITSKYNQVHIVFGMASDKDVDHVMCQLPTKAHYYWTRASVHRAMDEHEVAELGKKHELKGEMFDNVPQAYEQALQNANKNDFVYVGGSCFVVADLLKHLQEATN